MNHAVIFAENFVYHALAAALELIFYILCLYFVHFTA